MLLLGLGAAALLLLSLLRGVGVSPLDDADTRLPVVDTMFPDVDATARPTPEPMLAGVPAAVFLDHSRYPEASDAAIAYAMRSTPTETVEFLRLLRAAGVPARSMYMLSEELVAVIQRDMLPTEGGEEAQRAFWAAVAEAHAIALDTLLENPVLLAEAGRNNEPGRLLGLTALYFDMAGESDRAAEIHELTLTRFAEDVPFSTLRNAGSSLAYRAVREGTPSEAARIFDELIARHDQPDGTNTAPLRLRLTAITVPLNAGHGTLQGATNALHMLYEKVADRQDADSLLAGRQLAEYLQKDGDDAGALGVRLELLELHRAHDGQLSSVPRPPGSEINEYRNDLRFAMSNAVQLRDYHMAHALASEYARLFDTPENPQGARLAEVYAQRMEAGE
ncbi:MAG: hypothetical protein EA378_02820 [Phycisphaerales bacterium]|nr:MAG: hypothetical protein EA378_02820 [Phycisphaerales bacterium]